MMTYFDFVSKALIIAQDIKTHYVGGAFGAVMNEINKKKYINNGSIYNSEHEADLKKLDSSFFGFDSLGLIKGILWGFNSDPRQKNGGAILGSNGIVDFSYLLLPTLCKGINPCFSDIPVGAILIRKEHVGIYIGNGFCVEASKYYTVDVQITNVNNIDDFVPIGFHGRYWDGWLKLPYINYDHAEQAENILVLCNNKFRICQQTSNNGSVYIKLNNLDTQLDLCSVDYDERLSLPVIQTF